MICIKGVESFDEVIRVIAANLNHYGHIIDNGEWQGKQGTEFDRTLEFEDVSFEWEIPPGIKTLQAMVQPNLPWAEDHFLERISGKPLNPPPSHHWWPFNQAGNAEHLGSDERFSHTYPERFWPKYAPLEGEPKLQLHSYPLAGIRFSYGDLSDLIELLLERPNTRQAFLPIWFPEDLMASRLNKRVPCTLGYHFMLRRGQLTCRYFMRSCDFFRYFQDDVYMAARLTQYICNELVPAEHIKPGKLIMHISSLHIFANERPRLEAFIENLRNERLAVGEGF